MRNLRLSTQKARELIQKYGSPLYVYDETILRERCREMAGLLSGFHHSVSYSAKANTNTALLEMIRSEGIDADAMSPGEIYLEQLAGFTSDRIFYVCNNVSADEMRYAIDRNIMVSVDSLEQLQLFGRINRGGAVAVRFNSGIGAGHHEKVVTSGRNTKFGVMKASLPEVKKLLSEYNLTLAGINQHIGSLFLDSSMFIESVKSFLEIAKDFPGLKFIDFGGGYGVPYRQEEQCLDLVKLREAIRPILIDFINNYDNKDILFKTEPGRYIVAECGVLLGTVSAVKQNYDTRYIGTDIGFNVLQRPIMYGSYHEIELLQDNPSEDKDIYTIVGNICETGDIIAKDRKLSKPQSGDTIQLFNAGAYGYSMASNYNCRLRPAEVLLTADGSDKLIRRRDTLEDLAKNF